MEKRDIKRENNSNSAIQNSLNLKLATRAKTHDHGRISTKTSVDSKYYYWKCACGMEGVGKMDNQVN
ncbi:hypothetical protein PIROE2DRAFT_17598 [Piromyces sp. E2]|nr:hypothetical protein PIROE2DRAFT_17598 [Piromyces sp. E2]|eukprot:OUM57429.1 hypothetical protein PIROE2DRAFT_17598 [Piromyces sp. E2]